MIDEIQQDAEQRMRKSVDSLAHELSKVRTGRASTQLLDHVMSSTMAARCRSIRPPRSTSRMYARLRSLPGKSLSLQAIEKAIMKSDLGVNPTTAGAVIRVVMPPLTEERRRDLIRIVESEAEKFRVAIRNIRRDANSDFKDLHREKEISEDEMHHAQGEIQKLTDQFIKEIDLVLEQKEKDLMTV